VGLVKGAVVGLTIYFLSYTVYDPFFIGSIYIAIHILITGGIHMDGFSDYMDLIGSRVDREKAKSVLKDPRKGSFAVMGVALNIAVSISSFSALLRMINDLKALVMLVILIYVASSESMYIILKFGRREPYEGLARLFYNNSCSTRKTIYNILLLISITSILVLAPEILGYRSIIPLLTSTILLLYLLAPILTHIVLLDSHRRLGFVSGDVIGFLYELYRLTALVSLPIYLGLVVF
jgi:adenosylcobinamide-GDP ribazoletransferase